MDRISTQKEYSLKMRFWSCLPFLGRGVAGALMLFQLITFSASAQALRVSGTVKDNKGETLIGVSVKVKGASTGVTTDIDGRYAINVTGNNPTLVFSYVGFQSKEEPVRGRTNINVTLVSDIAALEEVVVVGYGTQKKETLTGAIASIKGEEILRAPVSNVANALVGRATGVTTTQRGGEPGRDVADIYIRGLATFAGSTAPLILVDGVERPLSSIDPYTIESLNILKDASATAVFGVRGANGVILITTKTGTAGKPQISFSTNFAMQNPIRLPKLLNSYDYATLRNEAAVNDATFAGSADPQNATVFSQSDLERYKNGDDPYFHPDIDWMDYMLKDYAPQQQYNLNVSGGSENTKYFASLGYFNQDGIYELGDIFSDFSANPNYKRYNIRTNFDFNVSKKLSLSIKAGTDLANSNYSRSSTNDIFNTILSASPLMSPVLYDGKIVRNVDGIAGTFQISNTPLYQMLTGGYNTNFTSNLNTNLSAKYDLSDITQGLQLRGQIAYDNYYNQSANRSKAIPLYDLKYNPNAQNFQDSIVPVVIVNQTEGPVGFAGESYDRRRKFYYELALDYNRTFKDHGFTGLVLGTMERLYDNSTSATKNDPYQLPYNYMGLVGRITYNYKKRYLAEFNAGYNGSENFAKGKQFGFFPSGSVGYILSEEPFFKRNPYVSYLKLRGSYGKVGNDRLRERGQNRFLFLPDAYRDGPSYYFGQNNTPRPGYTENSLGNPNVTWEVATKLNAGLDINFFRDKLSLSADYFTEQRENILWGLNVPITFGNPGLISPYNIGQAENKGYEFELGFNDKIGATGIGYSLKANYSFARNKIIYQDETPPRYPYLAYTGSRIGQPKGLQALGIFNTQQEIDDYGIASKYQPTLRPGDIKYKDQNGDNIIDEFDYVNIGNTNVPEKVYGINLGVTYKGFELNALVQGAGNVSTYLSGEGAWPFIAGTKTAFEQARESWSPERYANGDKISLPILTASPGGLAHNYITSSFWQQDASYLRLKNVELAYTFKTALISKIGLKYARVFVNGQNLLTKTDMPYFDPEIANSNGGRYPMARVFNFGTNIQF